MANKTMLIDATHPEETRVVVISGNRLEDFDVEVATRKQLKGNIYLAKVVRVEPSLQAAFVEYGGSRHGFLAFDEIHPDYYQIPIADREALLAEDEAAGGDDDNAKAAAGGEADVETVGGDDTDEVAHRRTQSRSRHYRIQEVVKRRQILLVQVVKEERGNKGAALTTYLSLAGRYCVLMPNTARGGGISRKITDSADRKRLKGVVGDMDIPSGIAVIVRTAGADRSKADIKRDYDYLLRLWESVRATTLESIAPALIHEEANLIKRSIRDLYDRDIEAVVVDGEDGYRVAKSFMKMLIPSHAKNVQRYTESHVSLFHRYKVESQMEAMHSPVVQLKSGAYIVIDPTEALVAVDVNSGRATRERNIEETALKTNLEAADEVARQLRLRDLAGLIVIDFIDMEVKRNNGQVERRLKEAMRVDRARIQLGQDQPLRAARAVAPEAATEPHRDQLRILSVLPRQRRPPLHRVDGIARPARHRGGGHQEGRRRRHRQRAGDGGALHPQPEARRPRRDRAAPCVERAPGRRRHPGRHRVPHRARRLPQGGGRAGGPGRGRRGQAGEAPARLAAPAQKRRRGGRRRDGGAGTAGRGRRGTRRSRGGRRGRVGPRSPWQEAAPAQTRRRGGRRRDGGAGTAGRGRQGTRRSRGGRSGRGWPRSPQQEAAPRQARRPAPRPQGRRGAGGGERRRAGGCRRGRARVAGTPAARRRGAGGGERRRAGGCRRGRARVAGTPTARRRGAGAGGGERQRAGGCRRGRARVAGTSAARRRGAGGGERRRAGGCRRGRARVAGTPTARRRGRRRRRRANGNELAAAGEAEPALPERQPPADEAPAAANGDELAAAGEAEPSLPERQPPRRRGRGGGRRRKPRGGCRDGKRGARRDAGRGRRGARRREAEVAPGADRNGRRGRGPRGRRRRGAGGRRQPGRPTGPRTAAPTKARRWSRRRSWPPTSPRRRRSRATRPPRTRPPTWARQPSSTSAPKRRPSRGRRARAGGSASPSDSRSHRLASRPGS